MKRAIEKYLKNGGEFDGMIVRGISAVYGFSFKDHGSYIAVFNGIGDSRRYSHYDLVFNPRIGFIDKLVGEVKTKCVADSGELAVHCGGKDGTCVGCRFYITPDADHHRSTMANLPDIKKLKEYVRTLI